MSEVAGDRRRGRKCLIASAFTAERWNLDIHLFFPPAYKTRFPEGGYPADTRRIPGGYPGSGGVLRMDFL